MNSLKRIFVSIKGQIDHVADEFENHEALAAVAIEDLNALASNTRVHLHRICKMSKQYQNQLQEQQEQARLWSDRAIKSREKDENKALQCVKRLRQTQQQISLIEQQKQQSERQELKIRDDLNAIQDQLQLLKSKKEILAARQNRANVQSLIQDDKNHSLQNIKNIFERWEGSVVGTEFETPDQVDSLAHNFEQEEDQLALKAMLDELTHSTSSDK